MHFKIKAARFIPFLIAAILAVPVKGQNKKVKKTKTEKEKQVKLHVDGLACPFCAYGLEKKLKSIKGAKNFKVDLKKGEAALTVPAKNKISKEKLKDLVKEAGFKLRKIEIGKALNSKKNVKEKKSK